MGFTTGGGQRSSSYGARGTAWDPYGYTSRVMGYGLGFYSPFLVSSFFLPGTSAGPYGTSVDPGTHPFSSPGSPFGPGGDPYAAGILAPPRRVSEKGEPLFTIRDVEEYYRADPSAQGKLGDIPRIMKAGGLNPNGFTIEQWNHAVGKAGDLSGRSKGHASGFSAHAERLLAVEEQVARQAEYFTRRGTPEGTPAPPPPLPPEVLRTATGLRWNPQTRQWEDAPAGQAQLVYDGRTDTVYLYGMPVTDQRHYEAIMRYGPEAFPTQTGLPPIMNVAAQGAQYIPAASSFFGGQDPMALAKQVASSSYSQVTPLGPSAAAGMLGNAPPSLGAAPPSMAASMIGQAPTQSALAGFQTPSIPGTLAPPTFDPSFVQGFAPMVTSGLERSLSPTAIPDQYRQFQDLGLERSLYQALFEPQSFEIQRQAEQSRARLEDSLALSGIPPSHPVAQAQLTRFDFDVSSQLLSASRAAASQATATTIQLSTQEVQNVRSALLQLAGEIEDSVRAGWVRDVQTYGIAAQDLANFRNTLAQMADIDRAAREAQDRFALGVYSTQVQAAVGADEYAAAIRNIDADYQAKTYGIQANLATAADQFALGRYQAELQASAAQTAAASEVYRTFYTGFVNDLNSIRGLFSDLTKVGALELQRVDNAQAAAFNALVNQLSLLNGASAFTTERVHQATSPATSFFLDPSSAARMSGWLTGSTRSRSTE